MADIIGQKDGTDFYVGTPPTTPVIAADTLGAVTPIELPKPVQEPDMAGAAFESAKEAAKSTEQFVAELTPPETETSRQVSEVEKRIDELYGNQLGRADYQAEQEKTAGVMEKKTTLQNIYNTMKIKEAEAAKIEADYLARIKNMESQRGVTTGLVTGQQREEEKQYNLKRIALAAEQTMLSAQAYAAQGNLSLAQEQADKAVDIKYSRDLAEIKEKERQLARLEGKLNKEEQIRYDAWKLKYAEERAAIEEKKEKQKENLKLALNNNVATRFVNRGGEFFSTANGESFSDPATFLKAAGVSSFAEAYEKGLITDVNGNDKVLSIAEANALNVPYGTTEFQARKMGITPQSASEAKENSTPRNSSPNDPDASKVKATPASIKSWVLENKRSNPDIPYYELWGMLTEELKGSGINPDNYDKILWEMLHPEGLDGYKKYVTDTKKKSDSGDPIDDLINNALKQSGI